MTFDEMWAALAPVGRSGGSGGYFRQPFASAERECAAWFEEEAGRRGLELERDAIGNTVAWWRPAGTTPLEGRVLTGSHLDSVLDGGGYDGPLGVVSALAAVDLLRERGFAPRRTIGVAVFVEEEGSRFGLACLGSRFATGTPLEQLAGLRDREGIALGDALDPRWTGGAALLSPGDLYLELHVEQGRHLVDLDRPVGVASAIWPHGRYRVDLGGEANHAGTTRMSDRHDPMATFARGAAATYDLARAGGHRATFGRIEVVPNSTNGIPSRVSAWLDARAASEAELDGLVAAAEGELVRRGRIDGVGVRVTRESVSPEVVFDAGLAARLGEGLPTLPTAAGHDAGVLQAAGVSSGMLFVRNPTGISHSPAEHATPEDCHAGVAALADALQRLAG